MNTNPSLIVKKYYEFEIQKYFQNKTQQNTTCACAYSIFKIYSKKNVFILFLFF